MSAPVALYIHVPFCLSVCPYCDFVVYGGAAARGPANRIARHGRRADDRDPTARARPADPSAAVVYLGGGTPSLHDARHRSARLIGAAATTSASPPDAEITLEVQPRAGRPRRPRPASAPPASTGSASARRASMLDELAALGRRHSPADIADTVAQARRAGFDNISLDLLYDVPGQTLASWQQSLETAIALAPEHISAYALTLDDPDVEGLTGPAGDHLPLRSGARRWRQRRRSGRTKAWRPTATPSPTNFSATAGYGWYEISNWAKPGTREPAQPCLLDRPGVGGSRARRPRLRRRPDTALERRAAGRLPRRAHCRQPSARWQRNGR